LLEQEIADEETLQALSDKARAELQEAIEFAENSDYPPLEEIYTDLYYEERRDV
jgi:pyruvate dehydrogenase E1 component alpha subunit